MPRRSRDKPKGRAPTHYLNPARKDGEALTLQEVDAIRDTYASLRSERGVTKALGFSRNTVRQYLHRGDPSRGILPLLQTIPALPAPPAPVVIQQVSPGVPQGLAPPGPAGGSGRAGNEPHAPLSGAVAKPLVKPRAAPLPQVAVSTPPKALPEAPPEGAPDDPDEDAPEAPEDAPPVPRPVPGVGVPLPAAAPGDKALVSVEHTVSVANNELARISRNTRALYDLRQRTLATMVRSAAGRAKTGETGRLSKHEREMLMLLREARVLPSEMLALHRAEVAILGVGEGKGVGEVIDPTDETKDIEGLAAELKGLLGERVNILGDTPDTALASARGPLPLRGPGER